MYLISIYFDEKTESKIRSYMKQIARHTENAHMLDLKSILKKLPKNCFLIFQEKFHQKAFNGFL